MSLKSKYHALTPLVPTAFRMVVGSVIYPDLYEHESRYVPRVHVEPQGDSDVRVSIAAVTKTVSRMWRGCYLIGGEWKSVSEVNKMFRTPHDAIESVIRKADADEARTGAYSRRNFKSADKRNDVANKHALAVEYRALLSTAKRELWSGGDPRALSKFKLFVNAPLRQRLAKLNDLPVLVDAPGIYKTRKGRLVEVYSITPTTRTEDNLVDFCVNGCYPKRGPLRGDRDMWQHTIWHRSGCTQNVSEDFLDLVEKMGDLDPCCD